MGAMETLIRPYRAYAVAILVTGGMVLLRWLVDRWVGNYVLFAPLLGAVAIAVWYGGYRPALVAMAIGALAYDYLFMEPRGQFKIEQVDDYIDLALFLSTCLIVIGFGQAMRVAQYRAAEGHERLRTTLASIGDAVIATDTEGRVTIMNAVAESLTGWTIAEAADQPLEAVFHIINEVSRLAVENPVQKVFELGQIVGLANHTVLIAKDGRETPIDDSAAPIRCQQGTIVGCVLVFRDVSEQRAAQQAKARLAVIVESSADAIMTKNLDGIIQTWNAGAEQLFGYKGPEIIGKPITILVPPDRTNEEAEILARLRKGQPSERIETFRVAKDGRNIPVAISVSPLRDRDGNVIGASSIIHDITERREAEEVLKAADRRKSEFLAMLAHELRNPLAPMRNSLQIMRLAGDDRATVEQALVTMERQVSQMVRLVDDLLDVARINRGKIELRRERVGLKPVIDQAVEVCRPLLAKRRHELTLALPSQPVFLHADPARLAQILSNLLNNACNYTEPGGRIWFSAERQGSDVLISVKDSGIGIPAEMLSHIFELFTQVDQTLERSQGGLGIGLTLVKQLVELHDGAIEVSSDGPGLGSEFVVRLPLLVEQHAKVHAEAPMRSIGAIASRRILVVDDNEDSAKSLAKLLSIAGHETRIAFDGLDAVAAAEEFRPDVVLLDIGLPRLNGFEACRRIREKAWGREITLVALTGWGQDEDRLKAKDAGFDHHLVKPPEYTALTKILCASRSNDVSIVSRDTSLGEHPA